MDNCVFKTFKLSTKSKVFFFFSSVVVAVIAHVAGFGANESRTKKNRRKEIVELNSILCSNILLCFKKKTCHNYYY